MHVEEAPRDKKAQGIQDVATDIQKSFHIQVAPWVTLDCPIIHDSRWRAENTAPPLCSTIRIQTSLDNRGH